MRRHNTPCLYYPCLYLWILSNVSLTTRELKIHKTDVCPETLAGAVNASIILGCKNDSYGNNQYMCLTNKEKSSLVEICHDGLMGLIEKGNCVEESNGTLITRSCAHFKFGCPDEPVSIQEYYKYPACQAINTDHCCYRLDPECPPKFSENEDTILNVQESCEIPSFTSIIIVVCSLILLLVTIILIWLCLKTETIKKGPAELSGEHGNVEQKKENEKLLKNEGAMCKLPGNIGRGLLYGIIDESVEEDKLCSKETEGILVSDQEDKEDCSGLIYDRIAQGRVLEDSQSGMSRGSIQSGNCANSCSTRSRSITLVQNFQFLEDNAEHTYASWKQNDSCATPINRQTTSKFYIDSRPTKTRSKESEV